MSSSTNPSDPHSEAALKSFPDYERAIEAYEEDENTLAMQLFDKLLKTTDFPDKNVCWYLKGQILLEQKQNLAEAWNCFLKAEELDHVDAKNLISRIKNVQDENELDEEEKLLRRHLSSTTTPKE